MHPVVLTLGAWQLAACIVMPFGAVALAYLLGIEECRDRGRVEGRRLAQEAREKARQQLSEQQWFPGGHRQ